MYLTWPNCVRVYNLFLFEDLLLTCDSKQTYRQYKVIFWKAELLVFQVSHVSWNFFLNCWIFSNFVLLSVHSIEFVRSYLSLQFDQDLKRQQIFADQQIQILVLSIFFYQNFLTKFNLSKFVEAHFIQILILILSAR